jgi:hypothetical protein
MSTTNDLINIITGKKELPVIKVEPTPETNKLIKTSVILLAGSLTLLALATMKKRK